MWRWWLTVAAWAEQRWTATWRVIHRLRRRLLLPIAHAGGRDMMLLTNGQWIDASPAIAEDQMTWVYSSERHALLWKGVDGLRLIRWPWISVSLGERDMSDFFQGLRLTVGQQPPSNAKILALFTHQRGWMPRGKMHVVRGDGHEEIYTIDHTGMPFRGTDGSPQDPSLTDTYGAGSGVNYVR